MTEKDKANVSWLLIGYGVVTLAIAIKMQLEGR